MDAYNAYQEYRGRQRREALEYERDLRRRNDEEKARQIVRQIADALNTMGKNEHFQNAFVDEMTCRTHRTLQQSVARLLVRVFEGWAEMGDRGTFDLRNEDTVEAAKKVREALKDHALPFI